MQHQITILPQNTIIKSENGANLRTTLIDNGFAIKSPCGGSSNCGECKVTIKSGFESLSDVSFEEKQILGNVFHITSERLSCQTNVMGDIRIDITDHIEKVVVPPPKTMRRTREQADTIIEERREQSKNRPQKEGGFKKPKSFTVKDD